MRIKTLAVPLVSFVFGVWLALPARADDWPQWLGPKHDAVWRETGILQTFPAGGPQVRWRTALGGGYAGPAVAQGRVYVTDRVLGANASNPSNPFQRAMIPGIERVLCLAEADGKILWKHDYECPYDVSYPAGPRTTPVVRDGKVYTLGAMGHLVCLQAETGQVIWSHDFRKDFAIEAPMWGFSAHPLLDGQKLICLAGGNGSTVVAYDKDTGKEIWRALSAKEPGYCPPVIIEAAGKRQLIVWHPESINSLNPETGQVYWSHPLTPAVRSGMTIPTPRQHGDLLFFSSFYNGSVMLRLASDKPAASLVWQSKKVSETDTDGLHCVMSTPFLEDGYIYGSCSYGQFRCLKADSGERVWESLTPTGGKQNRWGTAFVVKNGDRFFLFNELGDLLIAKLSPKGYEEISRAHLLEPTGTASGRAVVWSHPAFANRSILVRNDKEIISVSLAVGQVGAP